jgi:hypothetical protein
MPRTKLNLFIRLESRNEWNTRTKHRAGIYSCDLQTAAWGLYDLDRLLRPSPEYDFDLSAIWKNLWDRNCYRKYIFGFKDIDTYRSWFNLTSGLRRISKDCILGIYHIDPSKSKAQFVYKHGTHQSIARSACLVHLCDMPSYTDKISQSKLREIKRKINGPKQRESTR